MLRAWLRAPPPARRGARAAVHPRAAGGAPAILDALWWRCRGCLGALRPRTHVPVRCAGRRSRDGRSVHVDVVVSLSPVRRQPTGRRAPRMTAGC